VVSRLERAAIAILRRLEPERAHALSLAALRAGLAARPGPVVAPRLAVRLAGLALPNPVGLAAGFDKNAVAVPALARAGFGFVEVGAATPRAQPGNPRPRLFRLPEDAAVINRLGFNNDGAAAIAARLAAAGAQPVPVGLNLGANRDSPDRAGDLAAVLAACGRHVDFATINVSSPNTAGLRDLQERRALAALLARLVEARAALPRRLPLFLKVAPDLDGEAIEAIAEAALAAGIDAIIATNTTVARQCLKSANRGEAGGLSGAPLFEISTRVLARLHRATAGRMPLIGVGGIGSADQAWAKLRAGASAVQLYTALVYQGLALVGAICTGLAERLAAGGHASPAAVAGSGRDAWL
jgi:dihydroorotate dehydrogenase